MAVLVGLYLVLIQREYEGGYADGQAVCSRNTSPAPQPNVDCTPTPSDLSSPDISRFGYPRISGKVSIVDWV
jgi:hypothetical protein